MGDNGSSRLSGQWRSPEQSSHARKVPPIEMVPWTAAHFPTEEARDRFLVVVATLPIDAVEGVRIKEGTVALVRWRPGHLLGLNDIAYAHGGRIVLGAKGGS